MPTNTKEYRKKYYKKHKKKILTGNKKWRVKHPIKYKRSQKKYYIKNKKIIKKRVKKYGKKHAEKYIKRSRKWYKDNIKRIKIKRKKNRLKKMRYLRNYNYTPKSRFSYVKSTAKRRGHGMSLSFKQYLKLISKLCYYCGISLMDECGGGLDRINNKHGYHFDNVLPCCGSCNKTRGDRWTVEEFKIMIKALIKFRKNKR